MGWEKENFVVKIPEELDTLVDTVGDTANMFSSILGFLKTGAEIVRAFLVGVSNPFLAALTFVLDQAITFIRSIRNSGVHSIVITPDDAGIKVKLSEIWPGYVVNDTLTSNKLNDEIYELEVKLEATKKQITEEYRKGASNRDIDVFKTLIGARKSTLASIKAKKKELYKIKQLRNDEDTWSMTMMSATQAIDAFINSLDDKKDVNRPLYDPVSKSSLSETTTNVGGVVLVLGFSGNISDYLDKIGTLATALASFLDNKKFNAMARSMDEITDKITNQSGSGNVLDGKLSKLAGKKPNWSKYKVFEEILTPLNTILIEVEGTLSGIKSSIKSTSDSFDTLIGAIDKKISQLDKLITSINDFKDWFTSLSSLAAFSVYAMYVPPQKGGMKAIKEQLQDDSDINSPLNDKIDFCVLVGFMGAGAGLGILASLMPGNDVSFLDSVGIDDGILFENDEMKNKFGLDTEYFDNI